MDEGNEILNKAVQAGKSYAKQAGKHLAKVILTNPWTYVVLACIILLVVVIGAFMIDVDINEGESGYTNVGDSNFSGQEIVDIAVGLHDFIRENDYAYSCSHNVSNGYSNSCGCNGISAFGKNNFEQYKNIKCIDCSAYVSWVLSQYLGSSFSARRTSHWFNNSANWPSGWQRVAMNDIEAGDILVRFDETSNTGHVGIYIGNGKTVEAGSTESIRAQNSYGNKRKVINAYEFAIRIP